MLIVPRTPTPPPLEDRDANDLSVEELRELHRKSQAARASLPHTRPDPFIADCFAQKEQQAGRKIKEEEEDSGERKRRKIARPTATSTQLTIDDDGNIREESNQAGRASQVEVIELD